MFESIENWISEFLHNILQHIVDFFIWLVDFFKDILLWFIDQLLTAFVALIQLIPLPAFITTGLNSLFAEMPPLALYFFSHTGLVEGLGIIGAGYGFRLLRKFATLFQW